jgi:hypothetical protein
MKIDFFLTMNIQIVQICAGQKEDFFVKWWNTKALYVRGKKCRQKIAGFHTLDQQSLVAFPIVI